MDKKKPVVFVSYSWDSIEHQQWVLRITNELRKKGIVATMDVFETQNQTVNLNKMMITNIKDSDYIVIVLTEGYAEKSDSFQGGVGFETVLTIPYIKENLNKLILIMRHNGDYTKVFPFHLKDVYAIDFSKDNEFNIKLDELIYKIHNVPLYEIEPVGEIPDLKPKKSINEVGNESEFNKLDISLIPKLTKITDVDKNTYVKNCYTKILSIIKQLLEESASVNHNFSYQIDEISSKKIIISIYINRNFKTGIKIWYGTWMGIRQHSIFLSYGTWLDDKNDSSMNEIINCEVDTQNNLKLKMTMNYAKSNQLCDADEIAREIWIYGIKNYL